jgi:PST family polysaccharide transporter
MLGLSAVARPFMAAVFGTAWLGSTPILQLLAPVGALQAVVSPVGWIFVSKGRTDRMLRWALFACPIMMGSFGIGVFLGSSVAVAASYLVVNAALTVPAFLYAGRLIGIGMADFREAFGGIFVASAGMAASVAAADRGLESSLATPAVRLSILVPLGVVVYVLLARALRVSACSRVARLVATALARIDRTGTGIAGTSACWLERWFVHHAPRSGRT